MVGPREILAGVNPARIRVDVASSARAKASFSRAVSLLRPDDREGPFWSRLSEWYRISAATYQGRPGHLPWIRWMLLVLEYEMRVALADPDFALPYRNWSRGQPMAIAAIAQTRYDAPPWNETSQGLRSRLGALIPAGSPEDPESYLTLCNADRLWAAWQAANSTRPYLPAQHAPADLFPHRRNDPIEPALTPTAPTNGQVLNISRIYGYDSLVP